MRKVVYFIMLNERIKKIRKDKNLTQARFAESIGITFSSVSSLESGRNNPSEQTIRAICSEFNVNRYWLETGEGDPYQYKETKQDLVDQIRVVMKGESDVAVAIVCAVASMPTEYLEAFYDRLQEQLRNKKEEE